MSTIYIETTIISALTSRLSKNVVSLSRQLLTRQWWEEDRLNHELFSSQFVRDEATKGDRKSAEKRLAALEGMVMLEITPAVIEVAEDLMLARILPEKARLDALHISIASVFGVEYLLTWNCRHIANAHTLPRLYERLKQLGFDPPLICTIEEMLGHDTDLP
jgi:hypothetical protein